MISSDTSTVFISFEYAFSTAKLKSPKFPVVPSAYTNVPCEIKVFPFSSTVFLAVEFKLIEIMPASSSVNNVPSPFNILILLNSLSSALIIPT